MGDESFKFLTLVPNIHVHKMGPDKTNIHYLSQKVSSYPKVELMRTRTFEPLTAISTRTTMRNQRRHPKHIKGSRELCNIGTTFTFLGVLL